MPRGPLKARQDKARAGMVCRSLKVPRGRLKRRQDAIFSDPQGCVMCTLSQPVGWTANAGVDLDGQKAAMEGRRTCWFGLSLALASAAASHRPRTPGPALR